MISIIVPIYNSEKTLRRCLLSIKNQTYQNIEVILVNDGSVDNSVEICNEFVREDSRFTLINQKNMGAGGARNTGLKASKGSYIGFVDSDDLIDIRMFDILLKNLLEAKADISIIQLENIYNQENGSYSINNYEERKDKIIYSQFEALKNILDGKTFGTHSVTKLFKKDIFKNKNYPNSSFAEDSELMIDIFLEINQVIYESTPLYFYIRNSNSSTEGKFKVEMFNIIKVWTKNEKKVIEKFPELYENAHSRVCWAYYSVLDLIIKSNVQKEYKKEVKQIVSFLRKNMSFILFKSRLSLNRRIAGLFLLVDLRIYKLLTKLQFKLRR